MHHRNLKLLCFLLAVPIFLAIGHDAYLSYRDLDFTKTMMFSNLGYMWTHYNRETYDWAQQNVSPQTWDNIIVPVLQLYTIAAAAIPALVVYTILILLRLFGLPPFRDVRVARGHKKGTFGFKSTDPTKPRMRYTRK